MNTKAHVSVDLEEGLWTVKYDNRTYFKGEKRKALFFAAKLAFTENVGAILEPAVQQAVKSKSQVHVRTVSKAEESLLEAV